MSGGVPGCRRAPLAEKALSEAFGRLRFQDTSRLVWRQQQDQLARPGSGLPPPGGSFLGRSRSARYARYGNPAVVVPDRQRMMDGPQGARSAICALM